MSTGGADLQVGQGGGRAEARRHLRRAILLAALMAGRAPALAQDQPQPALQIFIECKDFFCDQEFLRKEISFVNHVRDRQDADVHILGTGQPTAGGGRELTLQFIGLRRFEGRDDRLVYFARQDDSEDVTRRGLAQTIKLGLMRYLADTPQARDIQISYKPAAERPGEVRTLGARDPWNFWVFRVGFNTNVNGERTSKSYNLNGNINANRTTEAWKLNFFTNFNYRENSFLLSDESRFVSVNRGFNTDGLVVKSLTDHWSAAVRAHASASTFFNQDLATRVGGGIEYNVFPYSQSTERQLTVQYTAGFDTFRYDRETIFGKLSERLTDGELVVSLDAKQPWGSLGLRLEAAHYFEDFKKNRLVLFGDAELKLLRGLSMNFGGNVSRIRDQFYLAKGEATDEEILARQRQLATGYRYGFFAGVSYRFGSIFNNVVNPRFGGGGGGFFFR